MMLRNLYIPMALGVALALTSAAHADPAYKASDIVKAFSPAPSLGATRGLCVGPESECGVSTPKPKADTTFNLLVNFDYNSDNLTSSARQNLDEFAKALRDQQLATLKFVVEGHTDGKGGDGYNLGLSERRAQTVVRYLRDQGIDTARLAAKGYGKAKPKTTDPLDPVNRRVETRLRLD